MSTKCIESIRKASLPQQAGGISDIQLRRYNNPNNDEYVFCNDPVYLAFPELREKMEGRTLTKKEYNAALEAYNAERIMLLLERDAQYVRVRREEMFKRAIEASRPWIVEGTKTWIHPIGSRYAAH